MIREEIVAMKNDVIKYVISACFLGRILVTQTNQGICAVILANSETGLLEALKQQYLNVELKPEQELLTPSLEAILNHLKGKQTQLNSPLDIRGTTFQQQVWQYLQTIPYGSTRTYQEIAQALNKPTASRAVAQACAKNPAALIIPCHRVIKTDGSLGGYHWGEERKKALIEWEQNIKAQQEHQENCSLWTNSTRRRYFLIPDHQQLPTGDFIIHNLTNESKQVELKVITNWEITRKQAQPYIEAGLNQVWQQAKTAFSTLTNFATAKDKQVPCCRWWNRSAAEQTPGCHCSHAGSAI